MQVDFDTVDTVAVDRIYNRMLRQMETGVVVQVAHTGDRTPIVPQSLTLQSYE